MPLVVDVVGAMNATSRAILQTILATDTALSSPERSTVQQLIDGRIGAANGTAREDEDRLLITQKQAAKLLCVSRVTVWRLTKDNLLHPVEILPGTWRYALREVALLARDGWRGVDSPKSQAATAA